MYEWSLFLWRREALRSRPVQSAELDELWDLESGLHGAECPPLVLQVHPDLLEPLQVVTLKVAPALLLQRLLQCVGRAAAKVVAHFDEPVGK